ncbi:hypothetical protein [Rummeliibacillus suwonensis]|uniref:hypothetical protein n=1 Tax=Rummeliibacillus suwonensis TaxID=1306154 RepID=UPI002897546B|nr:hypothetical protein [Rummeliibacillus suwonensis]
MKRFNHYVKIATLGVPLCAGLFIAPSVIGDAATNELHEENIIINNQVGKSDYITIAGIQKGDEVVVYDHPSMYTPIEEKKATSSTLHFATSKLKDEQNTLYFILKRNGEQVGTYKAVTYQNPVANHLVQSGLHLVNRARASDTLNIHEAKKGYTYRVYKDVGKMKLLASTTAKKDGYLSIRLDIPAYEGEYSQVYITVQANGTNESEAYGIAYDKGHSTPPNKSSVSIKNNKTYADEIHISSVQIGDVIKVYRTKKESTYVTTYTEKYQPNVLASRRSSDSSTTVYVPQLGKKAGTVYVTITHADELESEPIAVKYKKE